MIYRLHWKFRNEHDWSRDFRNKEDLDQFAKRIDLEGDMKRGNIIESRIEEIEEDNV